MLQLAKVVTIIGDGEKNQNFLSGLSVNIPVAACQVNQSHSKAGVLQRAKTAPAVGIYLVECFSAFATCYQQDFTVH